jgi:hypothetical protein
LFELTLVGAQLDRLLGDQLFQLPLAPSEEGRAGLNQDRDEKKP